MDWIRFSAPFVLLALGGFVGSLIGPIWVINGVLFALLIIILFSDAFGI